MFLPCQGVTNTVHGSELRLTLDVETSKTGDSHHSGNSANGIEEVTRCRIRAESARKTSLAASRFNCENPFHGAGRAFVNLDSVP
jgi:hypothetical protein